MDRVIITKGRALNLDSYKLKKDYGPFTRCCDSVAVLSPLTEVVLPADLRILKFVLIDNAAEVTLAEGNLYSNKAYYGCKDITLIDCRQVIVPTKLIVNDLLASNVTFTVTDNEVFTIAGDAVLDNVTFASTVTALVVTGTLRITEEDFRTLSNQMGVCAGRVELIPTTTLSSNLSI